MQDADRVRRATPRLAIDGLHLCRVSESIREHLHNIYIDKCRSSRVGGGGATGVVKYGVVNEASWEQ